MQLDPTRTDAMMWITSYASIYHKPDVPLFDLLATGKKGADPRMFFSWYAADYVTDPAFESLSPEGKRTRARRVGRMRVISSSSKRVYPPTSIAVCI